MTSFSNLQRATVSIVAALFVSGMALAATLPITPLA
jgi:hypothetical protein